MVHTAAMLGVRQKKARVRGMPWQTGKTQYNTHLELSDKSFAIKELVVHISYI